MLKTKSAFFQGFGPASTAMYDFLMPVIQSSTDVKQPQHVYLVEDGLELWHVTLLNAPRITPGLLDVYRNMPDLLGK